MALLFRDESLHNFTIPNIPSYLQALLVLGIFHIMTASSRRQCGGDCVSKGMKVVFNVTQGDKAGRAETGPMATFFDRSSFELIFLEWFGPVSWMFSLAEYFFEAGPWPASAPKRFTHLPCPVTCVQNIFAKKHNLKNTQRLKVTYCRNTSYKYLIHLLLSGCKVFLPAMLSSLSILGSSSTALLQNLNGGFSQQWGGFMWNEHFLRSEASLILR